MAVSSQFHTIIGLPRSGKTTFLAALWHLIDAGEVSTKLVLDKLVGDNTYLNQIVSAWRRCEEVPRTSMLNEKKVAIHAHVPGDGQRVLLSFPDLSGESFKQQFIMRECSPDYVEGLGLPGGMLLFINANRPTDGLTIADITSAVGPPDTSEAEARTERAWTPDFVPEQVRLVDLLQFLQRSPFSRRCRRLAVVISAWDAVLTPKPTPEKWLDRELPLLHQFLSNNPQSFQVRVYGVSAQGGDVTGEQRTELLKRTPSARIECIGPNTDPHDLTAPILWLGGGDSFER